LAGWPTGPINNVKTGLLDGRVALGYTVTNTINAVPKKFIVMNDKRREEIVNGVKRFCLMRSEGVPWKDPELGTVQTRFLMSIELDELLVMFSVIRGTLDEISEELIVVDSSRPVLADQLRVYNTYPVFGRHPVHMPFAHWDQTEFEREVGLDGDAAMKHYLMEIFRRASADRVAFDRKVREIEQQPPHWFGELFSSIFDRVHSLFRHE
jgi:hypothetical protein